MVVIAVVCALLVGSGAAYGIFRLTNSGSPSKSAEVLLQPGADTGPDPYTASVASTRPQVAGTPSPAAGKTGGGDVKVASTRGSAPGLYGGTQQEGTCNTDQLVTYLRENPSKAAAWTQALNSDPGLRWSGGSQVRVEQIDQYAHELTSVLLRTDTRITNHGYRNGSVTTFASVLQAGSAVLVDQYGVPRARCACGNPLTGPTSLTGNVVFVGQRWQTFSSTSLVVIASSTTIVNNFTLVNVNTGAPFARPAGGGGASDGAADPSAAAQLAPGRPPGSAGSSGPPAPGVAQATPTPPGTQSPNPAIGGQAPTAAPTEGTPAPRAPQPAAPQAPTATPTTPSAPNPALAPTPSPATAAPTAPPPPTAAPATPPPTPVPTPSASATPDFTPFVGTWTAPDGATLEIRSSGSGTYKPPQGAGVPVELKEATDTSATGTRGGTPITLELQGGKLVLNGVTFTKA